MADPPKNGEAAGADAEEEKAPTSMKSMAVKGGAVSSRKWLRSRLDLTYFE